MSQASVLRVLKKAKRPLPAKEIARRLRINTSTVNSSLRRLWRQREISYIHKRESYLIRLYYV